MTVVHAAAALRIILDGLLGALVVFSLSVLVIGRLVPLSGHPTLIVAGGSMEPSIPVGAAVILDEIPPSALVVGDEVSLRSGAQQAVFTHRIVRVVDQGRETWLETKGDANPRPDPSLTPASAVLGRVAVTLPYLGYALTLYSSISGMLFAVALGLILLVGGMLLEPLERTAPHRLPMVSPQRDRGRV